MTHSYVGLLEYLAIGLVFLNLGTVTIAWRMTRAAPISLDGYHNAERTVTKIIHYVRQNPIEKELTRCKLRFQASELRRIGTGELPVNRHLCEEVAQILEGITEVDIIGLHPLDAG